MRVLPFFAAGTLSSFRLFSEHDKDDNEKEHEHYMEGVRSAKIFLFLVVPTSL